MPDVGMPGWFRAWVATTLSTTVYGAVGVTFGALLWLAAPRLGYDPWQCFFVGSCIPPGLMAWYNSSDFATERRLIRLRRWRDQGLISESEYPQDRERARLWRNERLFGKPAGRANPRRGRKLPTSEVGRKRPPEPPLSSS